MHELGIANSVLDAVRAEARRHPGALPVKVAVRVGKFAGVNPDALAFGFEVLTSKTEWERLRLEVECTSGDDLELAYLELEEP
jgi:hydrogenase nickel incorporation protein HypA/HybF